MNKSKLMQYLDKVDLFAYPAEIIALAYCLGADDPSEVIGIPIDVAGSEEDFYQLVCKVDEARLTQEYESF